MNAKVLLLCGLALASWGCATILGGLEEGTARDAGASDASASDAPLARCPAGWLDGYAHRVAFDVASTAPLDDHSLRLGLETKSLIAQNKMRADGSDIRVTMAGTGQVLPHYLEAGLGGDATTLWTKARLVPGENRLFLYYGRQAAEQTSSVRDTFLDGILKNASFDQGTSPWIAYPPAGGGAVTLTITDGRAIIALERSNAPENAFGFCQSVVFPAGRSYRLLLDARVIDAASAELVVWRDGIGGPSVLTLPLASVHRAIETSEISPGPTLLCFGGRVASAIRQVFHAEVANLRVRAFASVDPIATPPSREESCP